MLTILFISYAKAIQFSWKTEHLFLMFPLVLFHGLFITFLCISSSLCLFSFPSKGIIIILCSCAETNVSSFHSSGWKHLSPLFSVRYTSPILFHPSLPDDQNCRVDKIYSIQVVVAYVFTFFDIKPLCEHSICTDYSELK